MFLKGCINVEGILFTQKAHVKKVHKASKKINIKKNENKEEGKEGEEGEMNWNYEKEESIKSEVGFSSEKALERRDAPKVRRAPPCTPSSSQQSKSLATFLIFFMLKWNLLIFLVLCVFLHNCI